MTAAQPIVSLVMPVYNEALNVERAVSKVVAALEACTDDFEIILVESGSTDGTRRITRELSQREPRVRVIHEMNREGYGSALKLGLSNAANEVVCYIDADEPFDVLTISEGLRDLDHCDLVIGYRIGPRENLRRLVFSRTYNLLIRVVFGLRVRDVNFSFKAFRRDVLEQIRVQSRGAFIDAELLLESRRLGARIHEHGFLFTPRKIGDSSLFRMSVVWKILVDMVRYWFRSWRDKSAGMSGDRPAGIGASGGAHAGDDAHAR